MDVDRIRVELDELYQDASLYDEANLEGRTEALDLIALAQEIIHAQGKSQKRLALSQRAASLQHRLQEANQHYFGRLEARIRLGQCTPESLRLEFDRVLQYSPQREDRTHTAYDGLDALVHGLLLTEPVPRETKTRTPEMVQYEATPAGVALDLVDRVDPGTRDVFYDLGSGLGHIVFLVHLLTGITCKGVELEPAFCDYARRCATRLSLSRVSFLNVDARDADYSDGTIFFMFTPFTGVMLQEVLDRLRDEAQQRAIRVCTYGSCTFAAAEQSWLRSLDADTNRESTLAVFSSIGRVAP
jgi:predicted RNA methylase